ncbi:MAG: hypothetical protein P8X68_03295 [Desulfobacterales bacterium]|jgi:hypothetical protein
MPLKKFTSSSRLLKKGFNVNQKEQKCQLSILIEQIIAEMILNICELAIEVRLVQFKTLQNAMEWLMRCLMIRLENWGK